MLPALIPLIAAGIGAAGSIGGAAIGSANGAGDREQQRRMMEQAMAAYGHLSVPQLQELMAQQLGPSAMQGVQTDPNLRNAQLQSLGTLKDFATNGDSVESRAQLNRIMQSVGRQEAASRNSIMNGMKARGVSGSGADIAAQLQNQQESANRAGSEGLDIASAAQKRILDAAMSRGQLAGTVRGQDFNENSQKAQALDSIARYNADSRYRTQVDNNSRLTQQFGMDATKAAGMAGNAQNVANYYGGQSDRAAATGAGIGQGIGQAASGAGSAISGYYQNQDNWQKYKDLLNPTGAPGGNGGASGSYGYSDPTYNNPNYYIENP